MSAHLRVPRVGCSLGEAFVSSLRPRAPSPPAHTRRIVRTHTRDTRKRVGAKNKQVRQARDRGFRVEVHAIGDRALASVLGACEEAGLTAEDRPIVTHCQVKNTTLWYPHPLPNERNKGRLLAGIGHKMVWAVSCSFVAGLCLWESANETCCTYCTK